MSITVTPRSTGRSWGMPLLASSVVALGLVFVACKAELTNGLTPPPRTPPVTGPKEIRPFSGNDQAGPVASLLPLPIVARIYDSTGIPVPGVPVGWTANRGGTIVPVDAVTDSDGNAVAGWILGDTAGPQRATASSLVGNALFSSNALRVLVRLSLQPSLATIAPDGNQQFTVTAIFSDSSTGTVPFSYSVVPITCGVITPGGLFNAGSTTGSCQVIATQTGGARLADTAVVNIVSALDTLSQISLSPRKASVAIGQTLQYAVSGTMSDGSTIVPNVSYSATGGTIGTSSGKYTPPASMGTFKVTATQVGGTVKDTTSVFVVAALVQDTAEPVFAAGVDQQLWGDNFDRYASAQDMQSGGLGCSPPWAPNTNYGQRTTPNASNGCAAVDPKYDLATGRDGTGKAIRSHYPTGYSGVSWLSPWIPNNLGSKYANGETVIIQFWFRISPGGLMGSIGMKWMEAWFSPSGDSQRIQWSIGGGGSHGGKWRGALGWVPSQGLDRTLQPVGPWWNQINDGNWHRATHLWKLNTTSSYRSVSGHTSASEVYSGTSSRDGRVAMWIDGVKVMDYSQATVGITPPGGEGVWCVQGDVDGIPGVSGTHSVGRISHIQFPEVSNNSVNVWTLDHDDLVIWKQSR